MTRKRIQNKNHNNDHQLSLHFAPEGKIRKVIAISYDNCCPCCGAQGFIHACRSRCSACGYAASCED